MIDSYPTWHPIVSRFPRDDYKYAYTDPSLLRSYYKGLDHTVLLAHGFISCPYQGADQLIKEINNSYNIYKYHDTSEIFKKISNQRISSILHGIFNKENYAARIEAERLDIPLYNIATETILVKCEWSEGFVSTDNIIPKNIAIPLMLEQELPCWRFANCAESWKSMKDEFLGCPNGSKSSLFVNQETGQVMKNIWNALVNTGMFGNTIKI